MLLESAVHGEGLLPIAAGAACASTRHWEHGGRLARGRMMGWVGLGVRVGLVGYRVQ